MRNPSKSPSLISGIEATPNGIVEKLDSFGPIDILINSAGYGYGGPLEDIPISSAHLLLDTLFWGPIRLTGALLPSMRARGSGTIINITSTEGISGNPGVSFYAAAKHALEGASEALAAEIAPFGIRVMIAEPGSMRTEFFNPANSSEAEMSEAYKGTRVDYVLQMVKNMRGTEGLDAEKCARRIVEAVVGGGEGWPEGREKMLRLPLGTEMLKRMEGKIESLKASMEIMGEVARSCDFV